jgi:plasmid stabilization system protein ParE
VDMRLLEAAKEDLRRDYRFYEAEAPGLGDYFLDCVQADIRSLVVFAGIRARSMEFYRLLVKRFPFAVYYLIVQSRVDVYAILDCRRDPTWTAARLRSIQGSG